MRAPAKARARCPSQPSRVAPAVLHRCPRRGRLHRTHCRTAPIARTSGAMHCQASCVLTFLLVRPFAPCWRLLRPLLTSRPVSPRRPFNRKARSPQVRTRSFPARPPDLRRLIFGHESFAVLCLLALIGTAWYPVFVHRPTVSLHASFVRSVALAHLRFASFAVASSREDFHLQDRAHAGRT